MVKVTMGGTEYSVPELNFAALERAWPFVEESLASIHPMKAPSAGICIIAAGLVNADHFKRADFSIADDETLDEEQIFDRVVKFLKKKIKASEIEDIRKAVILINEEAGLLPDEGELLVMEVVNPSEETAPNTLQSLSLPDVREEAGKP